VFIGAGAAAVVGTGAGLNGIAAIAFAHGLTIMAFAFAYGNLSGAHFNPAVTVGVLAARAMSLGGAIGYIISQLVAGVCAAFLLRAVLGGVATGLGRPELAQNVALGATALTITPEAGFVIEAVLASSFAHRMAASPESFPTSFNTPIGELIILKTCSRFRSSVWSFIGFLPLARLVQLGQYPTLAMLSGDVLGNHIRPDAPPFSVASEIFVCVSAVLDHIR
jgi:glycerol uptake facilitator-like aquaporin